MPDTGAPMVFDTATNAPPKAGEVRVNATDWTTASHVYVSDVGADGISDVHAHAIARRVGDQIRVADAANVTNTLTFRVTGAPVDANKYVDLPVAFVAGGGSPLVDQQAVTVQAVGANGWRPDSGAIDRTILDVLKGDYTLTDLMPGGVWFGLAAPGLTRFVLVTVDRSTDDGVFGHRGAEELRYVVQAVGLSRDASIGDMKAAAARIDALLDDPGAPLPVPTDFASIDCVRDERLADSVVDEIDRSLHWHHFGGYYTVTAAWPD